jgi:hypothetical protein
MRRQHSSQGNSAAIGDRHIVGEVDRRTRQRFEQALIEGRTAALLAPVVLSRASLPVRRGRKNSAWHSPSRFKSR